jgi:hypothetical protein
MLLHANSRTEVTSETTADGVVSRTIKSRTLKVSAGGAAAIVGVSLFCFLQFSVKGAGIEAKIVGWFGSQPGQATVPVAFRPKAPVPIEPYPALPYETSELPQLQLTAPRKIADEDVPLPRPREKRNWYQIIVTQGDDARFLRIFECGADGWPPACNLESDAERRDAAETIYPKKQ